MPGFWLLLVVTLVNGAPFVTTWSTNTTNEIVSFHTIAPETNVTIDWGDNTALVALSANVTYSSPSVNHTYATPGKYNVSISGRFRWTVSGFDLDARVKLLDIVSWGDGFLVDRSSVNLFRACSNMQVSAPPNTQPVFLPGAILEGMFGSTAFNSSLDWDLKNVTTLAYMLSGTPLNKPITFTNTQGVTSMAGMFASATSFNQPISFDCSSVTTLNYMFSGASSFNSPLNLTNTDKVVIASNLFRSASEFNQPITFRTDSLAVITGMFWGASKFNQPVNFINMSQVNATAQMFQEAREFNQPINFSSSSNLIFANGMFTNATSFNQPVIMATDNVTTMDAMFSGASSFASTVNFTSTSKVTDMDNMFYMTSADFTQNLASWNTSRVFYCINFCPFCGLPSFTNCTPCGNATRVTTTENTTVCNTRAPTAAPTAAPSTAAPTTATPTSTSGSSLAPSTAMEVSAAKAANIIYSMMAVLLCSLWVCLSV